MVQEEGTHPVGIALGIVIILLLVGVVLGIVIHRKKVRTPVLVRPYVQNWYVNINEKSQLTALPS